MKATYNWIIESIAAKKVFKDKNGNIRNNVIKDVIISFNGKLDEKEEKEKVVVSFDIVILDDFKPVDDLTNEQVLSWALAKLNPKEKERIEKSIMRKLGDLEEESNLIQIIINEQP
jgi:hypothetical protein